MMPFWTAVAVAKASYIFTLSTLTSMVCSATVPAAVAGEGRNDLGVVGDAGDGGAGGGVERQPVRAGVGGAVGAHLQLRLQRGDFGLDLGLVGRARRQPRKPACP